MARYVPVSRTTHASKAWRRVPNFLFAAKEPLMPVVAAEFSRVAAWMPIAFVEQAGQYVPVAMMCPMPGHNLFVGPEGQWLGGYIPASLRAYPFALVRREGSEQAILCVDDDSGLVVDADAGGEAFFGADGGPSAALAPLMDFMTRLQGSRTGTDLAMAALAEAGVIEQWPFEVQFNERKTSIDALYRVNEAALAGLDDAAFLRLRKSGALPLAYAQLLSMGQNARFDQLLRLRQQLQTSRFALDEIFKGNGGDTLKFD